MSRRRGFTILEMMIAVVLLAIIGGALMRMLVAQTHLFEKATADRATRSVTRAALNLVDTDLRMVEATGGLVGASANTLLVRAPYAVGIVCGPSGGGTAVSLAPVDSASWASAGLSGYAWRDATGAYNYVEGGVTAAAGGAAACTAASVTTITNGRTVVVSPAMPAAATAGTPMLLEQRLRYEFKASAFVPGALGLWRTVLATGTSDELVAPFTNAARFRFFTMNTDSSQSAVPSPLSTTRGIEFVLAARSERAPGGAAAPESTLVRTAVFFRNRLN